MRWEGWLLALVLGALVAAVIAGGESHACGPDLQVHSSGAFRCMQSDWQAQP